MRSDLPKPRGTWTDTAAVLLAIAGLAGCAFKPDRPLRFIAAASPPLVFVDENGKAAGVNVDLFNAAAQRAGYSIEWVVTKGNPADVLIRGEADLFHALPLDPPPPTSLYVTKPWIRAEYAALFATGKDPLAHDLRASLVDHPIDRVVLQRLFPNAVAGFTQTREEGLTAICGGAADAVITSPRILASFTRGLPAGCEKRPLELIERADMSIPVAVGARHEHRRAASRIRGEITDIVGRGEAAEYYAKHNVSVNRSFASMVDLAESEEQRERLEWLLSATVVLAGLLVAALASAKSKNREARGARAAAEEATRAKSEFLAVMSHEIRTPLHGCLGLTELLLSTKLTPEQRELAELSARSARDLNSLLGDILDLSRIESAQLALEQKPFSPRALLEYAAHVTRVVDSSRQVKVFAMLGESLPPALVGDENRIRQVLSNLTMNARKFTTEGSITIRGGYETGMFRVSVQDTGTGIPAELLPRVFERFEQGDASNTRRYRGSGLGLAIAKGLVEHMSGKIGVSSVPGRGSTFWFELPLPVGELPTVAAAVAAPRNIRGTVLLVEDNAVNRKVAARLLGNLGLRVDVAADGETAIRMAGDVVYAAILMDCQMPGMDGFETTRRIRLAEQQRSERTPIIALTANVSVENREQCEAAGMDDFLAKPIDVEHLAATLRMWVETLR